MKMNILILVITFSLLNHACGDKEDICHKTIVFNNTSINSLYVVSSSAYPDTSTFAGIPNPALNPNFTKVLPNEKNTQVLWRRDCIELAFKDLIPSDTLMVYVFDANLLENTPWDTVKENHLILIRYDLSLEDLNGINWLINYP